MKLIYKIILLLSNLLPKSSKIKLYKWLISVNNKHVLKGIKKNKNDKTNYGILILLPRCLQYSKCEKDIISSIENCRMCGKCKIKDIIELSEKYDVKIKVATGGRLAKKIIEENKPDYIVAVACETELVLGINEVISYNVLAIPNIITDQPCINTDVEIKKIEEFINYITLNR